MKFLYHSVYPAVINQCFGVNAEYYKKFLDAAGNPEKGHSGIDYQAAHGTPYLSPCDGNAFYLEDSHGGCGIYVHTIQEGQPFYVIAWHLCGKNDPEFRPLVPTDGTWVGVKTGQVLGYTDNSGAPFESSGDHLHRGLIPLTAKNMPMYPNNGFNGCVDPTPYLNGFYAKDITDIISKESAVVVLLERLIAYLKK